LESKEVLEPELLSKIAQALKVPEDAIENFDEQKALNSISNTFTDFKDNASGSTTIVI
jgi:hypothetical protein